MWLSPKLFLIGLRLAALPMAAFNPAALAQQAANLQETRSVVVNVIDRHGDFVHDLIKDDFLGLADGKPAAVSDARYSATRRRILVLLDMSPSMTQSQIVSHPISGSWCGKPFCYSRRRTMLGLQC
jgi:hypothetical protein